MKYKLIDHTADFGIHVFGADLPELFANAAFGMFDQITDMSRVREKGNCRIDASGDDWPDLMVNWLRELLFLWTGNEFLIKQANILNVEPYRISADIVYDCHDPGIHSILNEIKAVTYYQILVIQSGSGWESKIIFDV